MKLQVLPVYEEFMLNKEKVNVLIGGAGSGKSTAAAQKLLLRIIRPNFIDECLGITVKEKFDSPIKILVLRKFESSHRHSTFDTFKSLIDELGLNEFFSFTTKPMEIIYKPTGSKIIFKGLDDVTKLKSIGGIVDVWFEEANEILESDFHEIITRARGSSGYRQFILTSNPIETPTSGWLKKLSTENTKGIYKKTTTFEDNPFLPEDAKNSMKKFLQNNSVLYRAYIEGEWTTDVDGVLLYWQFNKKTNVVNHVKFDDTLPLLLSFDFNVKPYSICIVAQEQNGKLVILKEYIAKLTDQINKLITAFTNDFKSYKGLINVYGDTSGKNTSVASQNVNSYDLVNREFKRHNFNVKFKVGTSNLQVWKTANYVNHCLASKEILIYNECKTLIDDLNAIKKDNDGGKLIEYDTRNGGKFEKFGHASDALRYLVIQHWIIKYNKFNDFSSGKRFTLGKRKSVFS